MTGLADRSLAELLDEVAAATPAPGGGTTAAVAAALGAALAGMAAAFGDADAGAAGLAGEAASLRARALGLAETELTAYAPVLEAVRLDGDDPGRPGRLASALSEAAGPPLGIARVAAEIAELAARAASEGKASLSGDAATGTLLAEAACRAAVHLVELDLEAADRARGSRRDPDASASPTTAADPRLAEAAALAARAAAARDRALRDAR